MQHTLPLQHTGCCGPIRINVKTLINSSRDAGIWNLTATGLYFSGFCKRVHFENYCADCCCLRETGWTLVVRDVGRNKERKHQDNWINFLLCKNPTVIIHSENKPKQIPDYHTHLMQNRANNAQDWSNILKLNSLEQLAGDMTRILYFLILVDLFYGMCWSIMHCLQTPSSILSHYVSFKMSENKKDQHNIQIGVHL